MTRSPAGTSPGQESIPADSPAHLPMAAMGNVAKPTWIIEEVVDFGIPEESEGDNLDFDRACNPRGFPFLGGCALWVCEEEVEEDEHKKGQMTR
mmetsp:Transcript_71126/g.125725  ORF Transcript_71126/g.125725 Transcript_71126/m.125725 type:complete len:94 (+) Transcript_71126:3-284(+)